MSESVRTGPTGEVEAALRPRPMAWNCVGGLKPEMVDAFDIGSKIWTSQSVTPRM